MCHRCGARGLLTDNWSGGAAQSRAARSQVAVARAFAIPPRDGDPLKRAAADASDWRTTWEASMPLEGTPGAAYVESRAVTPSAASAAGVRFAKSWYGRPAVLFPVLDRSGALVAVSGRFTDGHANPKTQTAGPKSLGVYATPGAFSAPVVAICEGQFDALALWVCGVASVALIGTSAPTWLPAALAFRPVLLATDADAAGDEAASRLTCELEARGARMFRLRSKGAKDWGEILEVRGADNLRARLAAFSETADDVTRAEAAWFLGHGGHLEAAQFAALLVGDIYIREALRARLRRMSSPDTPDAMSQRALRLPGPHLARVTYSRAEAQLSREAALWERAATHPEVLRVAQVFGSLEIVSVSRTVERG
jgi:5S rRNA maturation endonuclease (ribonuclease M5)